MLRATCRGASPYGRTILDRGHLDLAITAAETHLQRGGQPSANGRLPRAHQSDQGNGSSVQKVGNGVTRRESHGLRASQAGAWQSVAAGARSSGRGPDHRSDQDTER
jgi:hypothetical protein